MIAIRHPLRGLKKRSLGESARRATGSLSPNRFSRLGRRTERNPRALGKKLEGFAELNPFYSHQKTKNISPDVAHPTPEELPLRIDLKARVGIVMPGTQTHEKPPLATQRDVPADKIDNIDRVLDPPLDILEIPAGGHWFPPTTQALGERWINFYGER